MDNEKRAKRIEKALYLGGQKDKGNQYCRVADAITDLRHFCDRQGINWEDEIVMSEIHYESEKNISKRFESRCRASTDTRKKKARHPQINRNKNRSRQ